tara:strand:+ start:2169 stop:2588 length:420 start_codon:yes stop_codon:yes gene_type:complete
MATNLKVQGNHIQYILSEIFGFDMSGGYTGHPMKQDKYNIYNLANGAITTEDDDRIKVHYFWEYRITVKNNLFTFAIVDKTINHVMKILTDEEQTKILSYLGLNVNCFACDKLYCKSHSYCILGDDDMPYCSKECFLNC